MALACIMIISQILIMNIIAGSIHWIVMSGRKPNVFIFSKVHKNDDLKKEGESSPRPQNSTDKNNL